MCMLACPFGNIHFDSTKLIIQKCDLCGGNPECVKVCIAGALQYEESEELFKSKRKNLDGKINQMIEKSRMKKGCVYDDRT